MLARLWLCLSVLSVASCISEVDQLGDACAPLEDLQPEGLRAWLEEGCYTAWAAESGVLQATKSDGYAQIYINPALQQSLTANNTVHPRGSAAVRVMYLADKETLWGYALSMKTTNGPSEAWFWFEHFQHHEEPKTAEFGASGCAGCHASGADFVQSTWPLR